MTTTTDAPIAGRRRRRPLHAAPDATTRGGARRRGGATASVFAGRNIEHIRQIPEKLLDVTLQPLMFVLLFAFVFGGAIAVTGGSYREYVIGGVLIQSLAFGLIGPATAIATDLTEGVVDRFRSLPVGAHRVPVGALRRRARWAWRCRSSILLVAGLIVGWGVHSDMVAFGGALAPAVRCSAPR